MLDLGCLRWDLLSFWDTALIQNRILYLGDRFAALAKPPGVSLATGSRHPDPCRALVEVLAPEERALLEHRELYLVHRLDRPTSGVVMVAFDREAHRGLRDALQDERSRKLYLALVWGRLSPPSGCWEHRLAPNLRDRRRMRVASDGKVVRTEYRRLATVPYLSWLALFPRTGRTHQLRAQLAHLGHPIVGDDLYGGPRSRGVRDPALRRVLEPGRGLLHLWRLQLEGISPQRFEAPVEPDFEQLMRLLGLALPLDLWQTSPVH